MRTIIVENEQMMIKRFVRMSEKIEDIDLVGRFEYAEDAVKYCTNNSVELAFLDMDMPTMSGVDLAVKLRQIRPDMVIVFVSAFEKYLWDFNHIGGDYYILKPFDIGILKMAMEKVRLIAKRQHKDLYIQTFGGFAVFKNGKSIPLRGKTKEILALVLVRMGKEISNEEIYRTVWKSRARCGNSNMNVFHNALKRLREALKKAECEELLISSRYGQLINTDCFDCDYFKWQNKEIDYKEMTVSAFMPEYSWGEEYLLKVMSFM